MKLGELKTQALRYLAQGEAEKALMVYRAIIRDLPADLDARMKVADVLVHTGQGELACRVYAAVAWCDLQAGRPLHALVCGQALADLGQSVASIHETLVALYGEGSQKLGKGKRVARFTPPPVDSEVGVVDLVPHPLTVEHAVLAASDTATYPAFPSVLPALEDRAN